MFVLQLPLRGNHGLDDATPLGFFRLWAARVGKKSLAVDGDKARSSLPNYRHSVLTELVRLLPNGLATDLVPSGISRTHRSTVE